MTIKKHIPNLLTLGNLLCGTIATIAAVNDAYVAAAILVVLGIVFDFFDGFAARILKVSGELGKQLDSLADMVTSGVVPGIIMFKLLGSPLEANSTLSSSLDTNVVDLGMTIFIGGNTFYLVQFVGLMLTLAACYRLANFNIDTRQSDSFIGLPTPAMSLFVISLPLIQKYGGYDSLDSIINTTYFLIGVTLVLSYLMNAEIPLFSLKFKTFAFKENKLKYLFLMGSFVILCILKFIAIPVLLTSYVCLSFVSNLQQRQMD